VKSATPNRVTTGSHVGQVFTATMPAVTSAEIRTSRFTHSQAVPSTPTS